MELRDKVAEYVRERIGGCGGQPHSPLGPPHGSSLCGLPGLRVCAGLRLARTLPPLLPGILPAPARPPDPALDPHPLPRSLPAPRAPRPVPERVCAAHQRHEVPAQLLPQGPAHQDVLPVPGGGGSRAAWGRGWGHAGYWAAPSTRVPPPPPPRPQHAASPQPPAPPQDPHFKACNHRRRIIQAHLLTEYAHLLAPGGWLYTITDVPELGEWMVRTGPAPQLRRLLGVPPPPHRAPPRGLRPLTRPAPPPRPPATSALQARGAPHV